MTGCCLLGRGEEHIPVDRGPRATGLTPELRASCDLASRRCSRCHTLDRVVRARMNRPSDWQEQVDKMRRQPASGITPEESKRIVRCLVYYSFGDAGLSVLGAGGTR